jgi:hypothetical protein
MDVFQMVIALLDILDATITAVGLLALWDMWNRPQQDHHQPAPNDIEINQFVDLARMHTGAIRSI